MANVSLVLMHARSECVCECAQARVCEHWPSTSDPESTVISQTPSASQGSGCPACLSSLEAYFHGCTPLSVAESGGVKAATVRDPIMAFGTLGPGADPLELHGSHRASPGAVSPPACSLSSGWKSRSSGPPEACGHLGGLWVFNLESAGRSSCPRL